MTTDTSQNPFPEQVIDAVRNHMNLDHAGDSLLIVRSLGNKPDATDAEVVTMDGTHLEFAATVGGEQTLVTVPWSEPLTERPQIRAEITRMYHDACHALGVTPREPEEH